VTGVGAAAVARASGKEGLKGDKNGGKHCYTCSRYTGKSYQYNNSIPDPCNPAYILQ